MTSGSLSEAPARSRPGRPSSESPRRPITAGAGWSAQHRPLVLLAWAAVLVAALALGNALGGGLADGGHPGGPTSEGAGQVVDAARWCWSRLAG
jgi:hypothetical protein